MENKTVLIRCEHCGGTMTVDGNNSSVLMCPYCGSKELMRESDEVKIEKIKNDTQKEIELKKLELEERKRKLKKGITITIIVLVALFMFAIFPWLAIIFAFLI